MKMPELPRSEYERIISEWIHSERDRAIVRRKYLDGITFEVLAEEYNLSVTQTKRIVYNGRDVILKHI